MKQTFTVGPIVFSHVSILCLCTSRLGNENGLFFQLIISFTYINNCRYLARKYARIFVRGHYLFREANSFPRAKLEENCELRATDNVQGQISEHIFAPNGDYCLYYPSNLFRNARSFENWGIFNNYSPKWRWLVVDIYRAAKRRGKYPTLATDTEENSCFSIY